MFSATKLISKCRSKVIAWVFYTIDQPHKSHNAHIPYPTMQHSETEMCTRVSTFLLQNGALWDMCLRHCGICEMGILLYLPYQSC